MASLKDAPLDSELTNNHKVVSKSKDQKQCDVKPKKKSGKTNSCRNSKEDNGCFGLRRTMARSNESDMVTAREESSRNQLLAEYLDISTHERDWEKEGGKPKHKISTTAKAGIPQERLVKHDQVKKKTSIKKSQSSLKVRKKQPRLFIAKTNENTEKSKTENASHINENSVKKKQTSNEKGNPRKTQRHFQKSKEKFKKNGKREHQSTSDSQSPSVSPRNENSKLKKATQKEKRKTRYRHTKKHTRRRTPFETEDLQNIGHVQESSDFQPRMTPSVELPIDNELDDSLSEPFFFVARPIIEFHRHFLSTVLAGMFSPSSSDWESDDSQDDDDDDDDDDNIQISSGNNSVEHQGYTSSEDSDSCCEEVPCIPSRLRDGSNFRLPDSPQHFDGESLMPADYHSEHSAEDSDISEDDLIYRVAEDYDNIDPLLSSLSLGIPQLPVSIWDLIMHQQLFASDAASTLYENVIMMLASHPELQNDGAPAPSSEETIAALPSVVATKDMLGDNTSCAICRSDYDLEEKLTQLPCKHMFHPICVSAWLHKSGTCPVCRFQLPQASDGT